MPTSNTTNGTSVASGASSAFDPHSLYSSGSGPSTSSSNNATPSKPSGSSQPASSEAPASTGKKQSKRRKVNLACIYCRRSHMTCDEGRPCQRCIKRDIGHLCHDETSGKPPAHSAAPAKKAAASHPVAPCTSSSTDLHSPASRTDESIGYAAPGSAAAGDGDGGMGTSDGSGNSNGNGNGNGHGHGGELPYFGAAGLELNSAMGGGTGGDAGAAASTAFIGGSAGPYSSASPMGNLNAADPISSFNQSAIFRAAANPLKGPAPAQGQPQASAALPQPQSFGPASTLSLGGSQFDWGFASNGGLGGAGWLGLGGGPGGFEGGGQGFSGDSAGGNEYTLLSEFLESLDGSAFGQSINNLKPFNLTSQASAPTNATGVGGSGAPRSVSRRNTVSGRAVAGDGSLGGSRASLPPPNSNYDSANNDQDTAKNQAAPVQPRAKKRARGASFSVVKPEESGGGSNAFPPNLGASKTERFFLTAADQNDGPRDERLSKVIQAKYEAGLLRPYNHVNGYARLNRWMERNVSQASKRRILKPLSVFRPAFRAVAQSLTNIDLIFIEEAFERLLLDYDRVFSTQGIPACLWRRTGEIYKGNKEFAELVGVPIESLREGRLCIYELMAEESAVNYWEKYGAVSFDPGQKAVLTSCVLRTKNKSIINGTRDKQSSAKLIAAQLPRAHGTTGSGQTTPTLAPQAGGPLGSGLFPLTPLDGGTRAAEARNGKEADKEDAASKRNEAGAGGAETTTVGSGNGGGGLTPVPGKEGKMAFLHCCFSFTIRRDQWNIPTMIVGNFLPTNPP
ncbi:Transcription factor [Thecaphora frezii]